MNTLSTDSWNLFEFSQAIRRDLHRHPELGFQEVRTAGLVARQLRELGWEVTGGVGKTGVVALIEGQHPGPVVLARFDMDALPVKEATEASYASEADGVMHACGHDGHVATGLTVARLLQARRAQIHGTVKLVFQPAEEGLGGACAMIADGVLQNPRPDAALALHLWNERPVGWAGFTPGPLMAGSDTFRVLITGRGGHGAIPNQTIDPVLAGAQIVQALQSIVARNVSPLQSAVVSVTCFHAGEAHNVIPQTAELRGTIRTFEPDVRELVLERFRQIVTGSATALGCQAEVEILEVTPAVINDVGFTQRLTELLKSQFPELHLDTTFRTMVSEDMAFMLQEIPGCYFMVGSANVERNLNYGHHHPKFDFDETVLPVAASLMTAAILDAGLD